MRDSDVRPRKHSTQGKTPRWKRVAAKTAVALLLHTSYLAVAQTSTTDFSSDQAAAAVQMQNLVRPDLSNNGQQIFINTESSTTGALGAPVTNADIGAINAASDNTSVDANAAANAARVTQCIAEANAGYPSASAQEKTECEAVITAAGSAYTPNPYFDVNSGKVLTTSDIQSMKTVVSTQQSPTVAAQAAGSATAAITSSTNCFAGSVTPPGDAVDNICHIELDSANTPIPVSCKSVITNTVNPDGTVTSVENKAACQSYFNDPLNEPGDSGCAAADEVTIQTGTTKCAATDTTCTPQPIYTQVCTGITYGFSHWDITQPYDLSGCDSFSTNPSCTQEQDVPTKTVDGFPVWADRHYSCTGPAQAPMSTGSNCSTAICVGGTCMNNSNTSAATSGDFQQAVVGMEILRESGVYATGANMRIFSGISDTCSHPTGPGIGTNCCQAGSGVALKTNRSVLPSAGWEVAGNVVGAAGKYGLQQASNYMYDFMFTSGNDWMVNAGENAWSSGAWDPSSGFNLNLSLYGFTMSSGAAGTGGVITWAMANVPGVASIPDIGLLGSAGNTWVSSNFLGSGMTLSFNPYMLALSIAIQIVMKMFSCSADEKLLSVRKDSGLCAKTGEWCSSRLPWPFKTCIQTTEQWCCWNSKLAMAIATSPAVNAMVGGVPRCGGFTVAELQKIDFSKVDLSAFINDIMASVSLPDATYNASTQQQAVNRGSDAANYSATNMPVSTSGTQGANDPNLINYATQRVQTMLSQ